jgi:hypothetical protein
MDISNSVVTSNEVTPLYCCLFTVEDGRYLCLPTKALLKVHGKVEHEVISTIVLAYCRPSKHALSKLTEICRHLCVCTQGRAGEIWGPVRIFKIGPILIEILNYLINIVYIDVIISYIAIGYIKNHT